MKTFDVVVVGKGNAANCAALAARDTGVSVAMLEAAAPDESGGNSRFAGGVMRFVYDNVNDLRKLIDITDEEARTTDWESNTRDQFYDDLYRVTNFRTDPELSEALITQSLDAMVWLRSQVVCALCRTIARSRRWSTGSGVSSAACRCGWPAAGRASSMH